MCARVCASCRGDGPRLLEAAHTLKSSSVSIGAAKLGSLAQQLQKMVRVRAVCCVRAGALHVSLFLPALRPLVAPGCM